MKCLNVKWSCLNTQVTVFQESSIHLKGNFPFLTKFSVYLLTHFN